MERTKRRRVSKACNTCRIKKTKCSGSYPCSRCKKLDTICTFGYLGKCKGTRSSERHMQTMEMQEFKLVAGLQTMYTMLLAADAWPGPHLAVHQGKPRVHDLLVALGLVKGEEDSRTSLEINSSPQENFHAAKLVSETTNAAKKIPTQRHTSLAKNSTPPQSCVIHDSPMQLKTTLSRCVQGFWRKAPNELQGAPSPHFDAGAADWQLADIPTQGSLSMMSMQHMWPTMAEHEIPDVALWSSLDGTHKLRAAAAYSAPYPVDLGIGVSAFEFH